MVENHADTHKNAVYHAGGPAPCSSLSLSESRGPLSARCGSRHQVAPARPSVQGPSFCGFRPQAFVVAEEHDLKNENKVSHGQFSAYGHEVF